MAGKLEAELPGIANWALAGLKRLRTTGSFTRPAASQRVTEAAAIETTPVRAWIRECLEVEAACDPGDLPGIVVSQTGLVTTKNGLYHSYSIWCGEHDMESDAIKSPVWFFRELRSILPKLRDTKLRDPVGGRMYAFDGVRLKGM